MDAAMLAAQNQRLDELNENIQKLAKSVEARPTKYDLEKARKRVRNQLIATILVGLALMTYMFGQQQKIKQACMDRNANNAAFRVLIAEVIEKVSQSPDIELRDQLVQYLNTLKPIEC
jgi:hypothetical protein